jgi:hypothetical protein
VAGRIGTRPRVDAVDILQPCRHDVAVAQKLVIGMTLLLFSLPLFAPAYGVSVPTLEGRTSAASAKQTQVVRDCLSYRVRPRNRIVFSCGDGNGWFSGMRWSHWRRYRAQGHGYMWLNDCNPDCADGHFHRYPVRVTLTRARVERHHRVFHRANSVFTGRTPPHPRYLRHVPLPGAPE